MSSLAWALRSIQEGPKGPEVGAFFDLDGTLVEGFTALAFLKDQLFRGEITPGHIVDLARTSYEVRKDPEGTGLDAIEQAMSRLAGMEVAELEARSAKVFLMDIAPTIRPESRELIKAHREAGHTLALATAATEFQANPVARDLGIEHVLSSQAEVEEGVLTGRLNGRARWGREKARAVTDFASERGLRLDASFAYGNGVEDVPFLRSVGHPVAVRPDRGLAEVAADEHIPILDLAPPPKAGLRGMLGTLGAIYTFNAGLLATLALADRSEGKVDFGSNIGRSADATLRVAGIRVDAQGVEHIDAARPAVMVFNHQSNLDSIVIASLVRRDLTGVGKAELQKDPRGFALGLFNAAFIDRSNPEAAKRSVNALVSRIHAGESVLMSPEGTRSTTPTLAPFKMGAFHLALDAQVPMLPIVLRNTGEHFPRGAAFIRPGTIDVCVLPPVSTETWTKENLRDKANEVRGLFQRTLEDWPQRA
ncbi:MAG: HAD-IB family hydrolase [Myxococcota bacterium]